MVGGKVALYEVCLCGEKKVRIILRGGFEIRASCGVGCPCVIEKCIFVMKIIINLSTFKHPKALDFPL